MPTDLQAQLRSQETAALQRMEQDPTLDAETWRAVVYELRSRAPQRATDPRAAPLAVRVVDFDMPFAQMVGFIVKWTLAAIPAMIILVLLAALLGAIFGGMAGLGGR